MTAAIAVRDTFGLEGAGREEWAQRVFQTIDAMDAPGFAAYFTPGGSFRMANIPAFVGRKAIEEFVAGFFAALAGLSHNITGLWEGPETLISEGVVSYKTKGGETIDIGYFGVMEFEGDLMRDYRAYLDPAPLNAALQAPSK